MAQPPVSYSNGTTVPPQGMYYAPVAQFQASPEQLYPSQVFPQSPLPTDMSSEIRGLPFQTMAAQSTFLQHVDSSTQISATPFSSQSNAAVIETGIPQGSQQTLNPMIPPSQPPFQEYGAGGQQAPFQGGRPPTAFYQPNINLGPIPAPIPPVVQPQDFPQTPTLFPMTQTGQRMSIRPQHYDQQYLQSNITCLQNFHDWLRTTAIPCVHDVRLILNELRNLVSEIDLCLATLVAIGVRTVIIARNTKDIVQGIYHRACAFLQRQETPVAADQTPAPAQEQVHNPNPWDYAQGQQQPHINPSFPVPGQTQFYYPNPSIPVPGQQQGYNTDPVPPAPRQTQLNGTNPSIALPTFNQPYHTSLSISTPTEVHRYDSNPSTASADDQPYYTSSRTFIPEASVQFTESTQEDVSTTPYYTPPETPSQIRFDFNWTDQ